MRREVGTKRRKLEKREKKRGGKREMEKGRGRGNAGGVFRSCLMSDRQLCGINAPLRFSPAQPTEEGSRIRKINTAVVSGSQYPFLRGHRSPLLPTVECHSIQRQVIEQGSGGENDVPASILFCKQVRKQTRITKRGILTYNLLKGHFESGRGTRGVE